MMRFLTTVAFLLASLLTSTAQAPVDGRWSFTMSSPMGTVDATVEMKTDGKTLTGTFDLGGGREWPIQDGVVDGDTISFVLDRDGRMTYAMKGTIDGDSIKGAALAMGMSVDWTMTRAK